MRMILAIAAVLMTPGVVGSQTLIGNCGSGITGIQLSTGNIYCITPPSGCMATGLDFTLSCNSQYLAVF